MTRLYSHGSISHSFVIGSASLDRGFMLHLTKPPPPPNFLHLLRCAGQFAVVEDRPPTPRERAFRECAHHKASEAVVVVLIIINSVFIVWSMTVFELLGNLVPFVGDTVCLILFLVEIGFKIRLVLCVAVVCMATVRAWL